jgi:hypothetical protein
VDRGFCIGSSVEVDYLPEIDRHFTPACSDSSAINLTVKLVPPHAHIRALAWNRANGQPFVNTAFPLGRPGVVMQTLHTDSAGRVQILQTVDLAVSKPVVSSVSDELRTDVTIDLAAVESGQAGTASSEMVSPSPRQPARQLAVRLDLEQVASKIYQPQSGAAAKGRWVDVSDPIQRQVTPCRAYIGCDPDHRNSRVVQIPP